MFRGRKTYFRAKKTDSEAERQICEQWQKGVVHRMALHGYTNFEISDLLEEPLEKIETWLEEPILANTTKA
ncbi:MAG: hypothetical protein Q4G03_00310 [Planctomycetia bacterium]|nr:hypothetical protein [Planctomycetia bacterium]